jgi:hypothetical protein
MRNRPGKVGTWSRIEKTNTTFTTNDLLNVFAQSDQNEGEKVIGLHGKASDKNLTTRYERVVTADKGHPIRYDEVK